MNTLVKEKLRYVLLDYLEVLTASIGQTDSDYDRIHDERIAEVRLLLEEVSK